MPNITKRKTISDRICDHIHTLLAKGEYGADGRLPTEEQLRRQFATSRSTVVKAMKELEHLGYIRRRAGAGSFAAHPGQLPKSTFAAILIAGLGDIEFFSPIGAQIAAACQKHNICLIWGSAGPTTEISTRSEMDQICRRLKEQQVSGVFFAPDQLSAGMLSNGETSDEYLAGILTDAGMAVILIDRDLTHYPERSKFDFVGIDNVNAAFQQTKHLYDQGCRKIIHVTRPGTLTTKEARIAGFRTALHRLGLAEKTERIHTGDAHDLNFVQKTLESGPDGVVCFNDPMASYYLKSLLALGIKVPDQIKVIGLDDLEYSKFLPVPLTTMRQPRREIGEIAVEMLIRRLNNKTLPPSASLLTTQLVVRESTGRGNID